MDVDHNSELIEIQISKFVEDNFKKTKEEMSVMTLQTKMSLISMKYPEKWDEFKLGLRKAGYII